MQRIIEKEKKKMNNKYNPMNKEFQDECKRLGLTGYELIEKYRKEGKIISITEANDKQKKVLDAGCSTANEYKRNTYGYKNKHKPMEFNKDCPSWFGDFTESLMIQTFEDPIKMPYGNPGFDWTCKRGDKIDNKGSCLTYDNRSRRSPRWQFSIRYNDIADWFILSAWDNRDSLTPLHVWAFHKNDIIGGRKFWRREIFSMANTPKALKYLEKYEITNRLEKLKELCDKR